MKTKSRRPRNGPLRMNCVAAQQKPAAAERSASQDGYESDQAGGTEFVLSYDTELRTGTVRGERIQLTSCEVFGIEASGQHMDF
ncbi:hypothetical protein R1flu_007393 [Riccia fluitans]|uniref:Uncharacterized protein n=1 Tax=Riccia fluitans TaxID=41844 RepID=A0ABD1YYQ9_9MARC